MNNKFLLFSALLGSALSATAGEFYLIKDGELAEGVEVLKDQKTEITMDFGQTVSGKKAAVLTNGAAVYQTFGLYVNGGLNLNKYWEMEIEYFYADNFNYKDFLGSAGNKPKQESFKMFFLTDTIGGHYDDNNDAIAHIGLDLISRDLMVPGGRGEMLASVPTDDKTITQYIYSDTYNPSNTDGKAYQIKIAVVPESGFVTSLNIKNLKIKGDGVKPFFATNFRTHSGQATIYQPTAGNMNGYVLNEDGTIGANVNAGSYVAGSTAEDLFGGVVFGNSTLKDASSTSGNGYASAAAVLSERLYDSFQGDVSGYYDTEHAFEPVIGVYTESKAQMVDKKGEHDHIIRVPFKGMAEDKIEVSFWLGHCGGEKYAPYSKYVKNGFPVRYRFDKGTATTYSNPTEWAPLQAKQANDPEGAVVDSIPTTMNLYNATIPVPAGDYDYVTISFVNDPNVSYMIGELQLKGNKWASSYVREEDPMGNLTISNNNTIFDPTAVRTIVAKNSLTVYPNPATSEITVVAEGLEQVVIASMTGATVLTSNNATVNVSSLASGLYIVKAITKSGVETATIVKK